MGKGSRFPAITCASAVPRGWPEGDQRLSEFDPRMQRRLVQEAALTVLALTGQRDAPVHDAKALHDLLHRYDEVASPPDEDYPRRQRAIAAARAAFYGGSPAWALRQAVWALPADTDPSLLLPRAPGRDGS